jgi:carboxyl-terminal processing protease
MKKTAPLFGSVALVAALASLAGGLMLRQATDTNTPNTHRQIPTLLASRDVVIPETDYFQQIVDLLKREYVAEVNDDLGLAIGAVRGMVISLNDPLGQFLSDRQFPVYQNMIQGEFEGIGVDLAFESAPSDPAKAESEESTARGSGTIPRLKVVEIVPGGPADNAGIRLGDQIDAVDGRWVVNSRELEEFRKMQAAAGTDEASRKRVNEARRELQEKIKNSMMPARAREALLVGTEGDVEVRFLRDGEPRTVTITKAESTIPIVAKQRDGSISVRVAQGAAQQLRPMVEGQKSVTIDLRNSGVGNAEEVIKLLNVLAPEGEYGYLIKERPGDAGEPLKSARTGNGPVEVRLIVDESVRGAAEVLALALATNRSNRLQGGKTAGLPYVLDVVALPDGSGYSMSTFRFSAQPITTLEARR